MNKLIFLSWFLFFLISCSDSGEVQEGDQVKLHLQHRIDSLQQVIEERSKNGLDKSLAIEMLNAYHEYVSEYPQDSLAAEYLFRLSDLARGVGDYNRAILSLSEICARHPDYSRIPDCLFLQGFYYQEFFKDTLNAKEMFNQLIDKYPEHGFSDDARILMQRFGKTDEEIIREFEENAKKGDLN